MTNKQKVGAATIDTPATLSDINRQTLNIKQYEKY